MRRESRQRRVKEKASSRGISNSFLEPDEEDEDGGVSIAAIKRKYKKKQSGEWYSFFLFTPSTFNEKIAFFFVGGILSQC